MTPATIDQIIRKHFPALVCKPRNNPDGWAYFYGQGITTGKHSNRIFRAIANGKNQDAKVKLAISARTGGLAEFTFNGTENELIKLITEEISLFKNEVELHY